MNTPNVSQAINTRSSWRPVLRPVGRLLIAAQLALVLQPLSALAQDKGQLPFNPQAQAQLQRMGALQQDVQRAKLAKAQQSEGVGFRTSQRLARAQDLVRSLQAQVALQPMATGEMRRPAPALDQQREQRVMLQATLDAIEDESDSAQAEFEAQRAELVAKRLPAEILQRHDQAVQVMRERAQQLRQRAGAFKQSPDNLQVRSLADYFEQFPARRRPALIEPGKLPWRIPTPATRLPAETQTAWHQNLYGDHKIHLAQAGNIGPLQFNIPPEPGVSPTTADLAETDEIQLTSGIRAKAAELNNNPVAIHNWVRNNIDFAPANGAIQSAQDTLDKKRGNATDTASLLIALLRAANIPARYQWGTIDIPAAQAMNWVGGATKPEAALQILNQGGIAARGISSAGQFTTIRLEHVWIHAYVNWSPSRGAREGGWNLTPKQHVNPNANLNAWVPLDASFKQFNYTAGMDLKTQVPLDANALLTAAQQGATVNQAEGWVQNLNQANIQNQLNAYQNRLKAHIDSSATGASSTVGDVIGKKIIAQRTPQMLAGTLPYPIVQRASESSAVPHALQHKFTYRLYASDIDKANDSPMLSFTEKTSRLVGKRLTLTYVPATQADADVIASYLPKPHADGSPIQPSELPTSLPGYLIRLKAQINLDGQVVATSSQANTMGTDLYSTGGFTQLYDANQWDLTSEETNVAGQATAIGLSAGGISATQLSQLKDRLSATQTKLQAKDVTGLSGEQISGDLLTATIWSWLAAAESHNRLSQTQAGIVENPGLSYGLFHAIANPISNWGVVRKVTFPGVNIDVGHVRNITWSKDNNESNWIAYNRLRGQYMSALEHAVPERFFLDPSQCNLPGSTSPNPSLQACPQGVSAVKAIAIAAQEGQKVFTITREVYANNPNIVGARLSAHSEVTKDKVQQALVAGYEVTIHERPIAQDGWAGAGFTIIDPATGAGGYLIEDGSNGGILLGLSLGLLSGAAAVVLAFTGLGIVAGVAGFLATLTFSLNCTLSEQLEFQMARLIGIVTGIVLAIIFGSYVLVSFTPLFVIGLAALLITVARLLLMETIFSST